MAKKKPVTQSLADSLSEIEAQTQAIVEYEFHERQAVQQINKRQEQINKLSKEIDEWSKALADTRSLLRAQREKLERDHAMLRNASWNLENQYCTKVVCGASADTPIGFRNSNPFE